MGISRRNKLFFLLVCITVFSTLIAAGCESSASTAENASPETLYTSDNEIDMFIYEGAAYVNALDLDWVTCERREAWDDQPLGCDG